MNVSALTAQFSAYSEYLRKPEVPSLLKQSIKRRCREVFERFLKPRIGVESLLHKDNERQALDFFFLMNSYYEPNEKLLLLLLTEGASIHSLQKETLFKIAVYGSCGELKSLAQFGFDMKSVYREAQGQFHEVTLLDLAVIEAERVHVFYEDVQAIEKVALLLERGANPLSCNNYRGQNYLHQVPHPWLIKLFGEKGVPVNAEAFLQKGFSKKGIQPIDLAYTHEAIEALSVLGADRLRSPFLKETRVHQEALKRIGFNPDEVPVLFFIKAASECDVEAFIALIGEGCDVNGQDEEGQTCLHYLFSQIENGVVGIMYDYVNLFEDLKIRLINMLIKSGAHPLRGHLGRTPLMCLTFHLFQQQGRHEVVEMYSDFEAGYYDEDPVKYKEQFYEKNLISE